MKTMRVPRSGSMILGMFTALVATALLPIVFMAALAASAEKQPRSLGETLREMGRPLAASVSRQLARLR